MTKVTGWSLPAWVKTGGLWPLSEPLKTLLRDKYIGIPPNNHAPLFPDQARGHWIAAKAAAADVISIYPGLDGFANLSERYAAMVLAIYDDDYDPRYWQELTPYSSRALTGYWHCQPKPSGGPLYTEPAAWFQHTLGTSPPDSRYHNPGISITKVSNSIVYSWHSSIAWAFSLPSSRPGYLAWPLRARLVVTQDLTSSGTATWNDWIIRMRQDWAQNVTWPSSFYSLANWDRDATYVKRGFTPPNIGNPYRGILTRNLVFDPLAGYQAAGKGTPAQNRLRLVLSPEINWVPRLHGRTYCNTTMTATLKLMQVRAP